MKTVLITGGTGLIGRQLANQLRAKGYRVTLLSRTPKAHVEFTTYGWNHDTGFLDIRAIAEADYIIHLAGANIGEKRWTPKRQQEIVDSRVRSGELLYHALKTEKHHVKVVISASAIGYYGAQTSETIFTETDAPATDFLGTTCKKMGTSGRTNRHIRHTHRATTHGRGTRAQRWRIS
ncbi:MAG: NAD-dependent epimerase/dehydratase family protein [Paludibacteraceae bacterium]|nr:NAD-dependent epimerase/dehydratase family protein [Paludibacteraceae bacterium]